MIDFANLSTQAVNFSSKLSFEKGVEAVQPFLFFVFGMILYAVLVYRFYTLISGKDVFKPLPEGAATWRKVAHVIYFVLLYPVYAFIWFLVMALVLSMLAETISIGNILIASMATVATIRVAAYYHEELAADIAKLIPLALLATLLLDITNVTVDKPMEVINQMSASADILFYYFIFVILLEFGLRVITWPVRHKKWVFKNWKGNMQDD